MTSSLLTGKVRPHPGGAEVTVKTDGTQVTHQNPNDANPKVIPGLTDTFYFNGRPYYVDVTMFANASINNVNLQVMAFIDGVQADIQAWKLLIATQAGSWPARLRVQPPEGIHTLDTRIKNTTGASTATVLGNVLASRMIVTRG